MISNNQMKPIGRIVNKFNSNVMNKISKPVGSYDSTDSKILFASFDDLKRKDIFNETVLLEGFNGKSNSTLPSDYPNFINARTVFMRDNYTQFHYDLLDLAYFPKAKVYYVDGHPADPYVLNRGLLLYFVDDYYKIANKMSPNNPNVRPISRKDFDKLLLNEYEEDYVLLHERIDGETEIEKILRLLFEINGKINEEKPDHISSSLKKE